MRLTLHQLAVAVLLYAPGVGPNVARAQNSAQWASQPITWKLSSRETLLTQGIPFSLTLTATIPKGWHLYAISQVPKGPIATHVTLDSSGAFELAGSLMAREPRRSRDPSFDVETATYSDSVTIAVPIVARESGQQQLRMVVEYQSCTDRLCLPPKQYALEMPLTVGRSFAKHDSTFALTPGVPNSSSYTVVVAPNSVSSRAIAVSPIVLVIIAALALAAVAVFVRGIFSRKEK